MSSKLRVKSKTKAPKSVKISETKKIAKAKSSTNTTNTTNNSINSVEGGAIQDDIIEKEDFDNLSEEGNDNDEIVEGEEQKEEDDDILGNEDYGDEEQKENIEEEQEEEQADVERDGSCLYKFAKKIMSDSEDENDDMVFEDDMESKRVDYIAKTEERETKPVLTKYERVRVLGDRAKQLSLGAKPMLLNVDNMDPKAIAKLELERGVIPLIIEKVLPDGRRERWKVSELKIVN
jgi:DNA-directed RNA polymerase subunit K/omega